MNNKQYRRAPQTPARPSKPALQRRSQSQQHILSTGSKFTSDARRAAEAQAFDRSVYQSDEEMAGLPQFCTTCDKLIVSPDSSVLYCSAACRRKDASRPLSMPSARWTPSNIPSAASYFDLPEPEIVPPRSPTISRPGSLIFSEYAASQRASLAEEGESSSEDTDSETSKPARHRSNDSSTNRMSTATDLLPSLSNTPSSSIGTVASMDRPLTRRYQASGAYFSLKSADLVTPSLVENMPNSQTRYVRSASLASSASTRTAFRPDYAPEA